jgi:hypothetical protein
MESQPHESGDRQDAKKEENKMGRYLLLWELDPSRVPVDPQERGSAWAVMTAMVKQDLKKGILKDWGSFVGQEEGYAVIEGTEVEVASSIQKYVPYVYFQTHPVATVNQIDEVIKALSAKKSDRRRRK